MDKINVSYYQRLLIFHLNISLSGLNQDKCRLIDYDNYYGYNNNNNNDDAVGVIDRPECIDELVMLQQIKVCLIETQLCSLLILFFQK